MRGFVLGIMWNGLGRGLPILVAVVATPVLIGQLGVDRWGLFALAMSVVGTFSILDLGISAALTRALAERIGTAQEADAPALVVTALLLAVALGIAGSTAAFFSVTWFVDHMLHVPAALRGEAILAFRILVASGPLVVANAVLWGALAAYQKFRAANMVGIPLGAMYFLGPMLLVPLCDDSLVAALVAIVAVRLVQAVLCGVLVLRLIPETAGRVRLDPGLLRYLVRIGGWVTISNTLAPLMTYADRFIVGAIVPLAAMSHYVTPVDFVWRLTMVPIAIASALFPAVATGHRRAPDRVQALLRVGSLIVIVVTFPVCAVMVGLGHEVMRLWLGARFAIESQAVLVIVGGGVFFSCLAALPGTTLDGLGRPDAGACLLMAQAVLFPPAVAGMTVAFGIRGAAAVWSFRAIVNCLGRLYLCGRLRPSVRPATGRVIGASLAGGIALLICALVEPLPLRVAATLAATLAIPILAMVLLLDADELANARRRAGPWLARLPMGILSRRSASTTP